MSEISPTDQLLADIHKQIAEAELDVRHQIDRLSHGASYESFRAAADEEWEKFAQRIKPLLDQRDYMVKQLVAIEACKPLPVMVIPRASSVIE